ADFGYPEQVRPLWILALVSTGGQPAVIRLRNDCHAFAAMRVTGVNVIASIDAASIHHELAAVSERVFHRVGVEILVHAQAAATALAIVPAAKRLGLDRPGVLHPAEMVNVVDVKVADAPAARPQETVEA